MRILMTTDTVGGVWTFTTTLTEQLLKRGHAVHLVSFGRKPSVDQLITQDALRTAHPDLFGFTNSDVPLEWMQNNEASWSEGAAILDYVSRSAAKPDLILSNQFCFGRLALDVPRIVVAHSDVLSWTKACKPGALEPSPWLNRYTSMVQAGLLDATAVVAPTAWMGRALTEHFFLPQNVTVIHNGVAVEPASNPEPNRQWQAITAGRLWDGAKGLDSLRDLPLGLPLLVAGDNSFESPDPAASWPGNLTSLGPLSPAALHKHFRESNVYLCPSRYEPFGLAPLEAALRGCAIVARDIPSLREVWADAALFYKDNESLITTLQALGSDFKLLSDAASRAGERAALFTPERMTDSYLHLFHSVLERTSGSAHAA